MDALTNVIVDVDAVAADHPALSLAADLAVRHGARLTLVDVLPWVPQSARRFVTDAVEQELVEFRRGRLKTLADAVDRVAVQTRLLRGRPATALVQEVLAAGHDLLVRSHDRDPESAPRRYGAIDMELLRLCPCPVWLVSRRLRPDKPWRILAALHPNPADPTEEQLNRSVLEWALMLREITDAAVTVLHAWTIFGGTVLESRLPAHEFREYVEKGRRAAEDAVAAFTRSHADRLAGVTVQLVEGEPEHAIVSFAERHEIDLVVMGTLARAGIPGLVMGNTAERVLQHLHGSVLAIKPPGFVSPVEPDRSGMRPVPGGSGTAP
jgi:nucleotide-binding universal stress UspA family protein